MPDADDVDVLLHVAFGLAPSSRRERARLVRDSAFWQRHQGEARQVLTELLDNYARDGARELTLPAAVEVPPLTAHGNVSEISRLFGGAAGLRQALEELQRELYAA